MNVSVTVFNIGLNKTGTNSLSLALNALDILTCHWRYMNNEGSYIYPGHIFKHNINAGIPPLTGIDSKFQGFSDFGGEFIYKELSVSYPSSKFIFTTRNLEDWLDSREAHVKRNIMNTSYQGAWLSVDRQKWEKDYLRLHSEIPAYFNSVGRARDLLVMDIPKGDGWNVLCPFLAKSIPDELFPKRNVMRP